MATYAQKTADDRCLILGVGEACLQPLGAFGAGWTSLQCGMYLSLTGTDGDDTATANESETRGPNNPDARNTVAVGLKNGGNPALPHEDGGTFFGAFHSFCGSRGIRLRHFPGNNDPALDPCVAPGTDQTSALALGVVHGATPADRFSNSPPKPEFRDNFALLGLPRAIQSVGSTDYAAFIGLRLTLHGRGTGAQTLDLALASSTTHRTGSPTLDATRARLHASDFSAAALTGLPATDADGAPVPVPDAVFLRWPFAGSRLRLHSLVVERLA